jgi:hypothetical protein
VSGRFRVSAKFLFAFFVTCTLAGFGAWSYLLTTICSNPRVPHPETHHVTSYNCHGMTVYISDFEQAMLVWFTPMECALILLMLVSGAIALVASANVRVDVQIHVTDSSGKEKDRED